MAWNNENISPSVTQETDAALVSLGQRGCAVVFDNSNVSGNFAAIQCITDNTFDTLDTIEGSGSNSPFIEFTSGAVVIPAGTIIYGRFTSITNGGGEYAIAYKA